MTKRTWIAAIGAIACSIAAPVNAIDRTNVTMLRLSKGDRLGGFEFGLNGDLRFDGTSLSSSEALVAQQFTTVEIYPSKNAAAYAIVFRDSDGQDQVRVYHRATSYLSPLEAIAGVDHVEWSPASKRLFLLTDYEGLAFEVFDLDRRRFSDLIDISGRGSNPNNRCAGTNLNTNWAFAGNLRWNDRLTFDVDEYQAKPVLLHSRWQGHCRADPLVDKQLASLEVSIRLDGSQQKIMVANRPQATVPSN